MQSTNVKMGMYQSGDSVGPIEGEEFHSGMSDVVAGEQRSAASEMPAAAAD
jgi:hypothetical protein